MKLSNLVGFLFAGAVFAAAAGTSTPTLSVFLDLHAFLIVVGGTVAASLICFSFSKITSLFKVFLLRIAGARRRDYAALIEEIASLSQARGRGMQAFEAAAGSVSDPFLAEAAEALFWVESNVAGEDLQILLENRAATHYENYMDEANIFRTIARFPPAFGLLGTTIGMIVLLQGLGSKVGQDGIGPAMALGLVATLYGIAISNFLLIPIAENLTKQTKEDLVARRMVVEGVMLIHRQMPTRFIEERLRSFLLPSQRGVGSGGRRKDSNRARGSGRDAA